MELRHFSQQKFDCTNDSALQHAALTHFPPTNSQKFKTQKLNYYFAGDKTNNEMHFTTKRLSRRAILVCVYSRTTIRVCYINCYGSGRNVGAPRMNRKERSGKVLAQSFGAFPKNCK